MKKYSCLEAFQIQVKNEQKPKRLRFYSGPAAISAQRPVALQWPESRYIYDT